jgi:hypothetical protein
LFLQFVVAYQYRIERVREWRGDKKRERERERERERVRDKERIKSRKGNRREAYMRNREERESRGG